MLILGLDGSHRGKDQYTYQKVFFLDRFSLAERPDSN